MQRNKKVIQSQSRPSIARVGESSLVIEPKVAIPKIKKTNKSGFESNVQKNSLKNGIVEDKEVLNNLCKQLETLGRPDKAERLRRLYFIKPEEKEFEEDDNLNLDSAKDFVRFFAMVDTSRGVLLTMDNYGCVSAEWEDLINGGFFNIEFLGNNQVIGLININGKFKRIELNLSECRKKLSELKLI